MCRQSKKNLLNSNISSTCPHNTANFGPLTAEIGSVREFGAFQQISTGLAPWLHYCSDVAHRRSTKVCTIFGRLLGWYTICIHKGSCSVREFCQLQNLLCDRVLRSPILATLLHGTPAAGVSQTLWRGKKNATTELSQRAPPISGWAAITLGIGPHSSFFFPRVISAVADWMSAILLHMVWP